MNQRRVVEALIEEQGELFSEAMGADIAQGTPQELFHWLCGTILLAARINHGKAEQAGRALRRAGYHKVSALTGLRGKRDLIATLRDNGYRRYDTVGADALIAAATLVERQYDGDLREMRQGDAGDILRHLREVKGIGATGCGIFAREMQLVWDEFYPRLGDPATETAVELGLTDDIGALVSMAGSRPRFVRLTAALTRAALDGVDDAVAAAG